MPIYTIILKNKFLVTEVIVICLHQNKKIFIDLENKF